MIEWEVLEEDKLPEEPDSPKRPRKPIPWKPILLVLILVAVVAGGGVAWRLRVVEQQVRADLEQLVLREERAIRLGVSEQASTFADPNAPLGWKAWYQSIYTPSELPLPTPTIASIERDGDVALVVVTYEMEGYEWRNARAYRLTETAWRRTAIPRSLWERRQAHASDFFIFDMTALEETLLPPEPMAQTLETFRMAWGESWPLDNAAPIKIIFSSDETLNQPQFALQEITLRSPLLNPTPTFAPPNACSLGILEALAQVYSGELYASGEDEYLRVVMRQAVLEELLSQQNGGCRIVEQARAIPPRSALGLPAGFAEYVVKVGGVQAAYTFLQSALPDLNLERAAQAATGHPLLVLVYGAEQYPRNPNATLIQAAGTVSGGINYGEIVRGIVGDDMTLRVREQQGVTVEIALSGTMQSVVGSGLPACLREGSQIAFTWEENTRVRDVTLLTHTITPIGVELLPPTTRLIYQQEGLGNTYVYALTAEGETVQLFQLAESVQITPHPVTQELAFLSRDGCSWVLNEYEGTQSTLRRWAVPGTPDRVIWVGNQPAVTVQTEDERGRAYWQVYMGEEQGGMMRLVAGNRGRLLGYSPARPGYLVSDDNALHWALEAETIAPIGGELATLPYRFAENVEYSSLSFDGRRLAYTVYPPDGRSDFNVLDTFENDQMYLNTIPANEAGGETRWSIGESPNVAVAVGDLGIALDAGMQVQMYTQVEDGSRYETRTYRANGEVDQLRWCSINTNQLTFRITGESRTRTVVWDGTNESPIPMLEDGARILWCP
jgi:hypothetical protein